MGLDPTSLPSRFTVCLDPESRKELGLETASERHARLERKLERDEQNTFAAWLSLREADRVLVYDWSRTDRATTNRKGLPDFRIYTRGRVLLIEMKVATGKLSADQEVMIEKFICCETVVYVCYSAAEAIERTRDWLMQYGKTT
jgi:VRR-NUC domain